MKEMVKNIGFFHLNKINPKKLAIEGRLEVEFSLEDEDKLFFNGEDFQKEYDGLTKLILN